MAAVLSRLSYRLLQPAVLLASKMRRARAVRSTGGSFSKQLRSKFGRGSSVTKWDCAIVVLPSSKVTHKKRGNPMGKTWKNQEKRYLQMVDFHGSSMSMLSCARVYHATSYIDCGSSLFRFGIVWIQESQDPFHQVSNYPISLGWKPMPIPAFSVWFFQALQMV